MITAGCLWLTRKGAALLGRFAKNAVIPDALFSLRFNNEDESYFMLEIDRGEMPIERYKDAAEYFAKKMMTYYEPNRQQRHVHDLGIKNFLSADGDNNGGMCRSDTRGARCDYGRARVEYVPVRRPRIADDEQSAGLRMASGK
jgi:hypothetical protein